MFHLVSIFSREKLNDSTFNQVLDCVICLTSFKGKGFTQMNFVFHNFLSFPNYQSTVRLNKVVSRGSYTSLEDIIRSLYHLNFQDKHIHEVYSAFHESVCLVHTLKTVRAVIIQTEPICCGFDKIHVLDNKAVPLSERVLYIRMHDYADGKLRRCRCNCFQTAVLYVLLGLFAITGLIISLRCMFNDYFFLSKDIGIGPTLVCDGTVCL
jgi:hypothetical protein